MKLIVLLGIVSAAAGARDLDREQPRKVTMCFEHFRDVLTLRTAAALAKKIYRISEWT